MGSPLSYVETLAGAGVEDADPGVVMGDENASDPPVFDHSRKSSARSRRRDKLGRGSDLGETGCTRSLGRVR